MTKFLDRKQLYRLLQRELPSDVYADGDEGLFYTTADMASVADSAASAYYYLGRIYDNYFPQTTDEYIGKWIEKLFLGKSFDPSVTLQQKRDAVIAKIRKQPTITLWEVLTIVASYVPEGTYVQVAANNCGSNSAWVLDVSELDVSTRLGAAFNQGELGIPMDEWCETISSRGWTLDVDQLDFTTDLDIYGYEELATVQNEAYGYEIRIFDYEVTGTQYQQMVKQIYETDPARSVGRILQNLSLASYGLVVDVGAVDQFSLIDCVTRDPSLSTGYRGRSTL